MVDFRVGVLLKESRSADRNMKMMTRMNTAKRIGMMTTLQVAPLIVWCLVKKGARGSSFGAGEPRRATKRQRHASQPCGIGDGNLALGCLQKTLFLLSSLPPPNRYPPFSAFLNNRDVFDSSKTNYSSNRNNGLAHSERFFFSSSVTFLIIPILLLHCFVFFNSIRIFYCV